MRQRKIQLKIKLARIEKQENESINDYLTRAQSLTTEIAELGTNNDESELISFIIEGLSNKFTEVTTEISSNSDISYEVIIETFLGFERKYDKCVNVENVKAFKVREQRKKSCFNCGKPSHLGTWHCVE